MDSGSTEGPGALTGSTGAGVSASGSGTMESAGSPGGGSLGCLAGPNQLQRMPRTTPTTTTTTNGRISNEGRKGAPRIRRADLPRKRDGLGKTGTSPEAAAAEILGSLAE